ncbi:MAG TPA: hypothetical protein PKN99_05790, partial [Cyclobacteriaceae bacterium]|nr:hypothetical protein [Cyclobacteriaceae bacterium]
PLQPRPPFVAYYNMRDFGGAMSNNLIVESTFKNSYAEGANACQYTEIRIQFAGGALLIPFSAKGCVSELQFMNMSGKKTDLSALGCDFTDWVDLKIVISQSVLTIQVEGNESLTFPIDFTPVKFVGIGFTFQGTGAVDYLKISNHEGEVYYNDDF